MLCKLRLIGDCENIFGTTPGKGEARTAMSVVMNDGAAVAKFIAFEADA